MTHSAIAAEVSGFAGLRPRYDQPVRRVELSELRLKKDLRDLLDEITTSERETWPFIILAAKRAGIRDEDLRSELGASPSTVHRWLKEGVAPREGTRRLMKGALLALIDERLSEAGPRIAEIG